MLQSIFSFVKWLFSPLYVLVTGLISVVALILGAISDPGGAVNSFICLIIDIVIFPLPSTPDSLKIGNLLQSFAAAVPIVGWGIILEIIKTCSTMLAILLIIKVYKLIPFKAT